MPVLRHLLIGLLLVGVAAGSLTASAASLGDVEVKPVAAGSSAVAACDGAMTVAYATTGGRVTSVTVGGIADPACEGATLAVRVLDAQGAAVAEAGPATVPADADTSEDTMSFSVADGPFAENVAATAISIVGP